MQLQPGVRFGAVMILVLWSAHVHLQAQDDTAHQRQVYAEINKKQATYQKVKASFREGNSAFAGGCALLLALRRHWVDVEIEAGSDLVSAGTVVPGEQSTPSIHFQLTLP
jgi:hypothetical protein